MHKDIDANAMLQLLENKIIYIFLLQQLQIKKISELHHATFDLSPIAMIQGCRHQEEINNL